MMIIRKNLQTISIALFTFNVLMFATCSAQNVATTTETFQQTTIPNGWKVLTGEWRVADGELIVDSLRKDSYILFGESSWQNYEVSAKVCFRKVKEPSRWLSILVRAEKDGTRPWSQLPLRFNSTESNGMEFAVRTKKDTWSVRSKRKTKTPSKLNAPRQLKVVVNGSQVQGYLDGDLLLSSPFCVDRSKGCIGLGASGCVASFDDVKVRHLPPTKAKNVQLNFPCDNVAHRGHSALAPENTLSAIKAAIKDGATGCEFDVYGCRDGTVVLMHDKTVDRTTNGSGLVTELRLAELRKLDAGSWKHAKYKDEFIPTLTEALQLLKNSKCQAVIEIKMEGISKQIVEDVRALEMVDQVAVIAFSQTAVREIRKLEPRIKCAWLHGESPEGTVEQQANWLAARAAECDVKILALNYSMLSPELVDELKQRGLGVWTWTVNEPALMQSLRSWGVQSITTDHPDWMRKILTP